MGFDKLMPEGRRALWKFLPCQGAFLSVTFGPPLSLATVRAYNSIGVRDGTSTVVR
jgi:hypothetical protein